MVLGGRIRFRAGTFEEELSSSHDAKDRDAKTRVSTFLHFDPSVVLMPGSAQALSLALGHERPVIPEDFALVLFD